MLLFPSHLMREKVGSVSVSLYIRGKNGSGQWRYTRVKEGRGVRTGNIAGPFYTRYSGVFKKGTKGQLWHLLGATTLNEAKVEAGQLETALEARSRGLTVAELDAITNENRIPIRAAVNTYLDQKSSKARKTVMQYRLALNEFVESLNGKIRFLDEVNESVLRSYKKFMEKRGYAGKTIDTRVNIVFFLLKKNGVSARLPKDEMPTIEEEVAVPYTEEEIKAVFAKMDPEEDIRYKFFLGTACRDQEVTFAAWQDIDFAKSTYHIRRKEDVGFTPKSHESRTVPLPTRLVAMLKTRHKNPAHPRWIFVNKDGKPDNHFLRKLKKIALRAGLNCGHCRTTITKGKYDRKREVEVTCATDPVCEHWYLHRLRKTCATRWQENGIPIRTIQVWLGQ